MMWLRLALVGSMLTPILHLVVLIVNGLNPVVTPISELSRHQWGGLHTLGLTLFGCSHVALAVALGGLDRGRLWPYARALLVASGTGLVYVAYYFSTASESVLKGPDANDPLWLVASLTGIAMGALQPGLWRKSHRLGMFSLICLGAWLWLVPVILFVNEHWLGAYERIVGGTYVVWMVGVTLGLLVVTQQAASNSAR